MVQWKEKYYKTKYRPVSLLLNINIMTYFKFKLQLKFINYFSVIINFHTRFTPIIHYLKIKIGKNKSYHVNMTAHWYIAISVLLQPHKQHLIDVTSFRFSKSLFSRSVPLKCTNRFVSVFP